MDYNSEGRHKVMARAWADHGVLNPQSGHKAGGAESSSSAHASVGRIYCQWAANRCGN